jgi:two-component system, OmpR family, sensor histidine kinase CssS
VSTVKNGNGNFFEKYGKIKIAFLVKRLKKTENHLYIITYSHRPEVNPDFKMLLFISLIIVFFSLMVAKLISNNLSKPLKSLELYTERIARKEWSAPLELDRTDEIGRLGWSMNQMQKSLQNADEEERAFLQSISHDLKTPVMVIKSYAEAIMDGVYIENLEETAKIISNESSKLEHKIKQLLYFNSLNYIMEFEESTQAVRLDLLVQDLYDRFKLVRSGIRWELNLEETIFKCNPERTTIALENIVDNQLRYAETKIAITIKELQNRLVIEIYNDGPHINAENIRKIFDKFYKDKKGHFGLGLAISQRIIEFYHGTIQAVNQPKGVSFVIEIPK